MNRKQRRAEKKKGRPVMQGASPGVREVFADALRHHQAGRLNEAERLYRQVLAIDPRQSDSLHLLGLVACQVGRHDLAVDLIGKAIAINAKAPEYHSNLGNALKELGKPHQALTCYRQALALKPNFPDAHYNLGVALQEQGRLDEAVASYGRALALKPDYAEALSNLGSALRDQGKLDEAVASCGRALAIKPDFAAHNNLGIALKEQGKLEEAVASYEQALALKPDFAEAHNNLGNALRDQGKLDEAAASYGRALALKPNYADALNNLVSLLVAQGEPMKALNIVRQSLQIKETWEAKGIFVACVKHLHFTHADGDVRATLVRALSEPWCRPIELASAAAHHTKQNGGVGEVVARATGAWPRRLSAQDLFGLSGLATVSADPLLRCLLESAPICDIELERFLTMARHAMLDDASGTTAHEDVEASVLPFYCALARQCFINEYVFAYTDGEADRARSLREALEAALKAGTSIPVLWPVAVAAYFPLHSLPLASRLLDEQWPDAVSAVLTQQVREPEEERRYGATIPRLTPIEDEVSLLVQRQYEENPYPRWIKAAPAGEPTTVDGLLRRSFPLVPFRALNKGGDVDILIAGCGTGQHSIETSQRIRGARVLAVDLSLTSLCYAKRKTRALGLNTIEYAQADILKLGSLHRSFDIIESVGVLHHLDDPMTGWRVLLSLLRPGGFMRLGFYSEVSRQEILRVRAFIAEQGYGRTNEEIRRCRQDLMNLDEGASFETTLNSSNFFTISECRDLLFHVQERRVTLPDIDALLKENSLQFLGFNLDTRVVEKYRARFPDDKAMNDLKLWHVFEMENPDTFASMYQFWIQKSYQG